MRTANSKCGLGDCPNFRVSENGTVPFDAGNAPLTRKSVQGPGLALGGHGRRLAGGQFGTQPVQFLMIFQPLGPPALRLLAVLYRLAMELLLTRGQP